MLEGIEILNQTEIMTGVEWTFIVAIICAVLMIIFLILTIIAIELDKEKLWFVMGVLTLFFFIACMFFTVLNTKTNVPTGKYEYQVTIDNNVSMTEFHEKYEIVEVEGKIYTIREKE